MYTLFVWLHCRCLSLVLSEGPCREPCVWLPVWPACGLHAGEVPLLRRSPSMEGMGVCVLASSEGHPPWKVWASVHYTVAVHVWEMYSFNFTNILVMSRVHCPFLNVNCCHYYSSSSFRIVI